MSCTITHLTETQVGILIETLLQKTYKSHETWNVIFIGFTFIYVFLFIVVSKIVSRPPQKKITFCLHIFFMQPGNFQLFARKIFFEMFMKVFSRVCKNHYLGTIQPVTGFVCSLDV